MKEEIIIDGVEVKRCEYLRDDVECQLYKQEYCELEDTTYDFCKEHPLCEFKAKQQLKRLEKENETLKITREKLLGDLNIEEESLKDYREHYNRLEKENEEAKKAYSNLNAMYNDNCDYTGKLENALEEISRRVQLENADDCLLDVMDIINKVLESEGENE